MNVDDEIRELLESPSKVLRIIQPANFLGLSLFSGSFQPEAVKFSEYLSLLDFRLENVVWKVRPPYSVLLRFAASSEKRYFVASTGSTMRLYRDRVDGEHLLMECQQVVWMKLASAVLEKEFGKLTSS
jgi:hypothetical protein